MKFSTAIAASVAHVALAKNVYNSYPVRRDESELIARGGQLKELPPVGSNRGQSSSSFSGTPADIGRFSNLQNGGRYSSRSRGDTVTIEETEIFLLWVSPGGGGQTQIVNNPTTVTSVVTVAGGSVQTSSAPPTGSTHTIMVGGNAGLVYTPSSIEAAVGDSVQFVFMSKNHTATTSSFNTPCVKLGGNSFDSGFMPNANNVNPPPQMAFQVTSTAPMWFYCRQAGHCGEGMTFSINPTQNKTQAIFQSMAIQQNGTGTATGITGGSGGGSVSNSTGGGSVVSSGSSGSGASATGSGSLSSASQGSGLTSGTGFIDGAGQCQCFVDCANAIGLPAANAQGLGMLGGSGGGLPVNAVMQGGAQASPARRWES